ncbi:MAG: hypothetical protein IJU23_01460 [Proteobacteria bacterium]|nr:hypothetical protein [Pseudomonadota bacterium]
MKKSTLMMTALCMAALLASCAEDNSQSCNVDSFVANCVDSTHYRTCVDGRIETTVCGSDGVCALGTDGKPTCISSTSGTCQVPGTTQCNGYFVQTCTNGVWVNAPSPCAAGCTGGVCNAVSQPECSTEKPCAHPAQSCENGKCVIVPECTEQKPCADSNKVCVNNTCVAQSVECSEQKPCANSAQSCVNGKCVTQTAECSSQKPCADATKTCVYGECKTMDSCQTNADCKEFNTLCSGAKCRFAPDIQCKHNDDCGPGFLCDNQTCLANDACSITHTCPNKQICHNGHCQTTPHEACSKENPCTDASKTCIQGQCITCNCKASGQTCDLNGNCVSTVHSDTKNVSEGDVCQHASMPSFCDGNVMYSCSSAVGESTDHIHARDCGANICTNSPTEDLNCHEACSVKGDFYGECLQQYYDITNTFMYYAFKTECTESDDGRLIWTFTPGYETCRAGCTNGSCDPVPVEYGENCQPGSYEDRCIDQWAMTCEKQENTGNGSIWGEDCAHYSDDNKVYSCAIAADSKVSGCVLPCTEEGKTTTVCHKYPNYLTVYSESLKCSRDTAGNLGYFMTSYEECANGCDDNTGHCK